MSDEAGRWVRAAAPASVSNVCCGFDLLGFAVAGWQDVVEARPSPEPGVRLIEVTGDDGRLPRGSDENTAGVAAAKLLELVGDEGREFPGVDLRLHKGLPLASGLGSSGASAVAALVATKEALGLGADENTLLAAAMEGERVACGTAHPDNVAPTLHGGLLLVRPGAPPELTELPVPAGLTCTLLHPHSEVATEAARAVLPAEVPLSTLTAQAGNLAVLVTGLFRGDDRLISVALVDLVAEPVRAAMTPGFEAVRRAALAAGALGAGLSGSGPTMFAWSREPAHGTEQAERIGDAMRGALERDTGLAGDLLVSPVGVPGARIVADGESS